MVGAEVALEIGVLHRHGKGIREIARETGSSRNTVRRYLRDESAAGTRCASHERRSSIRSGTMSSSG
jgi:predicted transcriptional regulator